MFNFACDKCDFNVDIDYVPRVYVLPDGRTLSMMQRHVWCQRCKLITVAESLTEDPDANAVRQWNRKRHLESLKTGRYVSSFKQDLAQQLMPEICREVIEEIDETDRLIAEWQCLRTAGQSCLRCGNTDIQIPEKKWADLVHVPCSGTLRCTANIIGGYFHDRRLPHKYNVDGELILRGRTTDSDDADDLYLWWPGT
jgi:hypothetical protein